MEERFPPAAGSFYAADGTSDRELESLMRSYPELAGLEPYYIEWEFIWPM